LTGRRRGGGGGVEVNNDVRSDNGGRDDVEDDNVGVGEVVQRASDVERYDSLGPEGGGLQRGAAGATAGDAGDSISLRDVTEAGWEHGVPRQGSCLRQTRCPPRRCRRSGSC
jgi:hypothetical protein